MIAVQRVRVTNLSDLSARLSSLVSIEEGKTGEAELSILSETDESIVAQLLKNGPDQIPLYLAHNSLPLQSALESPLTAANKMWAILEALPSNLPTRPSYAEIDIQQRPSP
jgi:hypothetical protein